MKKSILFIALAALLLSFVSYESATAVAGETEHIDSALVFGYPDATVRTVLEKYKTQYSKIPYFTKFANGKYLFYVVQGNWIEPKNDSFPKGSFKMGIIDEKGNVLLPVEYDKLYNPDGTVNGFIEIERNGKRGLYNYTTKKIIAAEYDVIYPNYVKSTAIAIGKKGDNFYFIGELKNSGEITNEYEIPRYSKNLTMWKFDAQKQKVNLYSTKILNWFYSVYAGNGIYFTPSYAFEIGCFPEVKYFIGEAKLARELQNKAPDSLIMMGAVNMVNDFQGEISDKRVIDSNYLAMIVSFYEEGVSGRDYFIQNNYLRIIDENEKVVDEKQIIDHSRSLECCCLNEPFKSKFINNNLVEVRRSAYGKGMFYSSTQFDYFEISSAGKINELQSNRMFNFTKYTLIDSTNLTGCYSVLDSANDDLESSVFNRLKTTHLDFMIQEIYAEYGLIFTDKKWADYFAAQSWYKPRYNNVDSLLTGLDKQNLLFIKKKKATMELEELNRLIKQKKEPGCKELR